MHINSASYDRNHVIFDIIITRPIAASSFLLGIVEELLTGDDGIRVRNLSAAVPCWKMFACVCCVLLTHYRIHEI